MKKLALLILLSTLLFAPKAKADSVTIDFENLSDSAVVGSNYAALGVIFSNAAIASAGISLNESEFPPHSGINVAIDATGPMTLTFTTPISSFSGFFTYAAPLTLVGLNASNQPVVTAASLFSSNFVSSGNAPNEFVQLNFAGGIDQLTITGDPAGGSFALDDVLFTPIPQVQAASEPGTLFIMVAGLIGLVFFRRFLRPVSCNSSGLSVNR